MNILVTGANGQLGNCMRNAAKKSADHYIFTDVAELDITNAEAIKEMVTDTLKICIKHLTDNGA